MTAEVLRRDFRGANILYTLRLDSGHPVQALVPSHCSHAGGERIGIRADIRHLVILPIESPATESHAPLHA